MFRNILKNYRLVTPNTLYIICAQFFLNLINTSFILIFNIYLAKLDVIDSTIADITSYRFLGVLCCAFPLGLYIKGKPLKPIFFYAGWGMPIVAFATIAAAQYLFIPMLCVSSFFMGVFFSCMQIVVLPFIIRNTAAAQQPEAISLLHATFSFSMVICSLLIATLGIFSFVDEKSLLVLFSIMGFISIYFIKQLREENIPIEDSSLENSSIEWGLILPALLPRIIIAVGAGLTIPYMNLFFYSAHELDYDAFSLLNFFTASCVGFAVVYVPELRRKYGLKTAVTLTQSASILVLILLATTDIWQIPFALYIAILCFIIRQPLMNMAGPMTAHLTMEYVGAKNQEITSALASAIWSGSWFISAKIFKFLRVHNFDYGYIFLITAMFYVFGVIGYYLLILKFENRLLQTTAS